MNNMKFYSPSGELEVVKITQSKEAILTHGYSHSRRAAYWYMQKKGFTRNKPQEKK